jgi:hypothetical protein
VRFETPEFEKVVFDEAEFTFVPSNWRKAHVANFYFGSHGRPIVQGPCTTEPVGWHRLILENQYIAVREDILNSDIQISRRQAVLLSQHLRTGTVLRTVGRKEGMRHSVGVWDSANRILSISACRNVNHSQESLLSYISKGDFKNTVAA